MTETSKGARVAFAVPEGFYEWDEERQHEFARQAIAEMKSQTSASDDSQG